MSDFLLAFAVITFLFLTGFATGKWEERLEWHRHLPQAMDGLCTECEKVGEEARQEKIINGIY